MHTRIVTLIIAIFVAFASSSHAKEYQLFYLGGQSNMDGYGHTKDLPEDLVESLEGIMIFHGNTSPDAQPVDGRGKWSPLQGGHGVGFKSDGSTNTYSERFGVELSFAKELRRRLGDDVNIAIVKYSRGGTSIDQKAAGPFGSWDPDFNGGDGEGKGVNQYDHFLATVRHASAASDIDGDGEGDTLVPAGIVWMQGESDAAYTPQIAEAYQANLKRLINLIRAAWRADDLPATIGRISDSGKNPEGKVWKHGDVVRAAQAAFVKADGNAHLVTSTDEYGYSDPWHYDSAGYLDLGRQFAAGLMEIKSK